MADFLVPIQVLVRIRDCDEDELEGYIDDFKYGLTESFSSSDPDDDHFRIESADVAYNKIKETYSEDE